MEFGAPSRIGGKTNLKLSVNLKYYSEVKTKKESIIVFWYQTS